MDCKHLAKEVLQLAGGRENIVSAAACATRLRIVIADNQKCDKKALEQTEGVKAVFETSGQMQVLFGGAEAGKVFEEFAPLAGIQIGAGTEEGKPAAKRQNIFFSAIKGLKGFFEPKQEYRIDKKGDLPCEERQSALNEIYSPLCGKVIPLEQVADETFAAKVLGDGLAVLPDKGELYAPFEGTVKMLYDTNHAISLKNDAGMEILIHIGIHTVELAGEYYEALVSDGDKIHKGDLLIRFDMEKIKEAGYQLVSPVILTNSDDFDTMQLTGRGIVDNQDVIIRI